MEQPDICKGCSESYTCARVYEQLGKAEEPSVTLKVIVAFLLPIATFISVLAACSVLLDGVVAPRYVALLGCTIALATTGAFVLAISTVVKRRHRTSSIRNGLI